MRHGESLVPYHAVFLLILGFNIYELKGEWHRRAMIYKKESPYFYEVGRCTFTNRFKGCFAFDACDYGLTSKMREVSKNPV